MNRIEEEKSTVDKMIRLYCRKVHGKRNLCEECTGLHEYAMFRLDKCRFGETGNRSKWYKQIDSLHLPPENEK